jgi:hypothetical protein
LFIKSLFFLVILDKNVIFTENVCPIVFRNANLETLSIIRISSSFIIKNVLNFQDLSENISEKINSRIFQLSLNIFHSDLSTKVLNKAVFKQLRVLDISGEINSIQNDLFESFQHLKLLRFRVQNVKGM